MDKALNYQKLHSLIQSNLNYISKHLIDGELAAAESECESALRLIKNLRQMADRKMCYVPASSLRAPRVIQ